MRTKPSPEIDDRVWEAFNELADVEGYGTEPADWMAWWECFFSGYEVGVDLAGSAEQT